MAIGSQKSWRQQRLHGNVPLNGGCKLRVHIAINGGIQSRCGGSKNRLSRTRARASGHFCCVRHHVDGGGGTRGGIRRGQPWRPAVVCTPNIAGRPWDRQLKGCHRWDMCRNSVLHFPSIMAPAARKDVSQIGTAPGLGVTFSSRDLDIPSPCRLFRLPQFGATSTRQETARAALGEGSRSRPHGGH